MCHLAVVHTCLKRSCVRVLGWLKVSAFESQLANAFPGIVPVLNPPLLQGMSELAALPGPDFGRAVLHTADPWDWGPLVLVCLRSVVLAVSVPVFALRCRIGLSRCDPRYCVQT